ncbi:hypothetical protein ACFVZW_20550 [Streptomyces sp. NPDC059567]|uniref:hypothetical protein n=1 Tax=Streptomyces sp. NPDC059567 TaxID=3346867 RepID=UPI003685ADFB
MRRLAPACLALAAALLGCSPGSGQSEGGGPAGSAENPAASGGPAAARQVTYSDRLPIARYSYTDAENAAIESAQQVLTRRCMRTYGITYEPPKPGADAPEPADRRYGLSSASEAARFGYHPNHDALPTERPALPKDAFPVLYGKRSAVRGGGEKVMYKGKEVPSDGCFGQSVGKLSKEYDEPAGAAVASRIATESYRESLTDPSVREGFRKWSACMRNSSFRYASPMDPMNSSEFQGKTVSAKEKDTAAADLRCKEETGLLDIWFQAESRIQKADIEKNAEALEKLRTAHHEKAEAARRIVAEG